MFESALINGFFPVQLSTTPCSNFVYIIMGIIRRSVPSGVVITYV